MFIECLIACDLVIWSAVTTTFFGCELVSQQLLLICFVSMLSLTILVHMFSLKCWKYLFGQHNRNSPLDVSAILLLFLFAESIYFVVVGVICVVWIPFGISIVLLCIYTASKLLESLSDSISSSSELLESPPIVNTD